MKSFLCGDVVPGCTKHFEADTEEQILNQVAEHALLDHGLVTIPASVVDAVREKIKDGVA